MKLASFPSIACGLLLAGLASAAQDAAPTPAPADALPAKPAPKLDYKQLMDPFLAQIDSRDPLGRIVGQMGSATELLEKLNTHAPTQPLQEDIVVSLDEFIEMLEKRKKTAHSGTNPDPDEPLPDSVIAKGPGGQRELRDPNASSRLWGQLPPKQREQILQSQNQGFPSGYEAILSSYYKRLAQENLESPVSTAAPPAGPATQPARQ